MATGMTRVKGRTAGAFDVRLVIAALFAIYGVVLTVLGIFDAGTEKVAKADNIDINLWVGIGMLVFAALFALWAWLRPIVIPEETEVAEGSSE